jgi:phospholipid/cholesterol/gamma-HCH transport system substrate-binding protein
MTKKKSGLIEIAVGGIVFLVACLFVVYSLSVVGSKTSLYKKSFLLRANFQSAEGLELGSDVTLAGVKVGTVSEIELDTEQFVAKATFLLFQNLGIPDDSEAVITSDGLLGEKYVSVNIGGSDTMLKNGDEFIYTQSSVNIFNLLGKFMGQ